VAKTDAGEDLIASCTVCDYAANLEKATSRLPKIVDGDIRNLEEFPTPGIRTIEELANFPDGAPADRQIKTLVYVAKLAEHSEFLKQLVYRKVPDEKARSPFVLALLRGDHQLQETKLMDALAASEVRPAHPDEIRELLGASAGSLGAVGARERARAAGHEIILIADNTLEKRYNMVTGANKDDFHLRGVYVTRDLDHSHKKDLDGYADLRMVSAAEWCPRCQTGQLEIFKAMEIGHIFKLGTKYSETMGAYVLNQHGQEIPIVMGSYGIGVERIITAAVEQNYDENGIIWPKTLAPFDVVVTITNVKDEKLREAGDKLYQDLQHAGLDVLLDDRDERAGVKFKDADLIGIPYRITLGRKIGDGLVELFDRRTKQSEDVKLDEIVAHVQKLALAGL
jgi:prolyl-tRNA synthetase